jgi:hypothetical protein
VHFVGPSIVILLKSYSDKCVVGLHGSSCLYHQFLLQGRDVTPQRGKGESDHRNASTFINQHSKMWTNIHEGPRNGIRDRTLKQESTNFPKFLEPLQNSECKNTDMKKVPYWSPTIRRYHTIFSRPLLCTNMYLKNARAWAVWCSGLVTLHWFI